jgi:hypothetical protein
LAADHSNTTDAVPAARMAVLAGDVSVGTAGVTLVVKLTIEPGVVPALLLACSWK